MVDIAQIVELIQIKWDQATGSTLNPDRIKKFLRSAVVHVESIDFPSGITYDISNHDLVFNTEPSNESSLLYVYKTLIDIHISETGSKVANNEIGVNWRSGLESVSSVGAGKVASDLLISLQKQYDDTLAAIKIGSLGMTNIDLYDGIELL